MTTAVGGAVDAVRRLVRVDATVPPVPRPGETAMSARGLGLRIGGSWLLRDVDLDLVAGEVLVVVGPNGAGKSTLLALLAGDQSPTAGTVTLGDAPARGTHPTWLARRRAVLTQRPELAFPFTAATVVGMGRAPWAGTDAEDEDAEAVAEALATADVEQFAQRRYPTLSGGEQARVSFARVVAQRTGVLLLDEPTAALDLLHQEQLMASARRHAEGGRAVLVVLHDLQLAAAYADRIAVLAGGALLAVGTPAQVLDQDLLEGAYGLPIEVLTHPVTGGIVVGPRRAAVSAGPEPDPVGTGPAAESVVESAAESVVESRRTTV
nr:heme ABC transporter ATP-binding protein [Jatrophihabitans endophyticus]